MRVERFGRFCTVVAEALAGVMTRACTINEPNIVATMGWHAGMFPPGKTDMELSYRVAAQSGGRHRVAVAAIREAAPGIPVGLTLSMTDYQLAPGGEERLESIRHHAEDVSSTPPRATTSWGPGLHPHADRPRRLGRLRGRGARPRHGLRVLPRPLGNCLRRAWDYTGGAVPLLVTENGIGTTDDEQRIDYVRQALDGVLDVIAEGIDVRGLHLLVAARQLRVGPRLQAQASGSSASTATPSPGRPSRVQRGSPRWRRPTLSTAEPRARITRRRRAPC